MDVDRDAVLHRLLEEVEAHAERPTGDAAFDRGYVAGLAAAALSVMEGAGAKG